MGTGPRRFDVGLVLVCLVLQAPGRKLLKASESQLNSDVASVAHCLT
jgi:hypothetical protein